jgi:hypothetical protein
VEVEDKSGDLERLVKNSMHFRTMNVREARSLSPSGRRRMSRYVNGSNLWVNFIEKLVITSGSNCPKSRHCQSLLAKMLAFHRSCDRFVQRLKWRGCPGRVRACATWSPTSRNVDSASEAELDDPFGINHSLRFCSFGGAIAPFDFVPILPSSPLVLEFFAFTLIRPTAFPHS